MSGATSRNLNDLQRTLNKENTQLQIKELLTNNSSSLSDILTELETISAVDFATEAKQDAQSVLIGAAGETAPGTDTESSGLNGRLQRIAQRLTSLINLFPSSIGQKTMANSLAVVLSSDQSAIPISGTVSVSGVATEATQAANGVLLSSIDTWLQDIDSYISNHDVATSSRASEATLGDVKTSVQLLDDVVVTEGAAIGTKGILLMGEDGSGNAKPLQTASDGDLLVHQHSSSTALADAVSNTMHIPVNQTDLGFMAQPTAPYVYNGTTWDRLRGDATNGIKVQVATSALPSGAATSANQTAEQTLIGAVNESAPGTDTASSGLNGRLQRIAQNITSLISWYYADTATITTKASSNANQTALASNSSRKGAKFFNDSDTDVVLKFGTTATTTDFTIKINAGGYYNLETPIYRGRIDIISATTGTGNLRTTELT
jgi:hypothetical protein